MTGRRSPSLILLILLTVSVLIAAAVMPASAAPAEKVYAFSDQAVAQTDGTVYLPCEQPSLAAGETGAPSVMRVRNDTDRIVRWYWRVELPYGDDAALRYLNDLTLRVTCGGKTLYEGKYCHVADTDGLSSHLLTLGAGEATEVTVEMSCGYGSTYDPAEIPVSAILWQAVDADDEGTSGGGQQGSAESDRGVGTPSPYLLLLLLIPAAALLWVFLRHCAVSYYDY